MNTPEVIKALKIARLDLKTAIEQEERALVAARRAGIPFGALGAAMGVSDTAARQRYDRICARDGEMRSFQGFKAPGRYRAR